MPEENQLADNLLLAAADAAAHAAAAHAALDAAVAGVEDVCTAVHSMLEACWLASAGSRKQGVSH